MQRISSSILIIFISISALAEGNKPSALPEDIRSEIKMNLPMIQSCAKHTNEKNEKLVLNWEISPNGDVTNVSSSVANGSNKTFQNCVEGAVSKIKFKSTKLNEPLKISYPITFTK